ncbi:C-type lectin domain family 4 member E-like [Danio aesculapii]|uniref:C-type lectin domain family 4 member E-like n=1 Tax=Danio aesculapii TaxID=1142201 RepID=UPI0024BF1769|nr:C-type lectin domain family 4 member E-like [Danio aesculapii]
MSGVVNDGIDKGLSMESGDRIERTIDIYITAEAVRNMKHGNNTKDFDTQISETQTPQHTGRNSVKNRSSKAALVCLVLLCFLLLTAVIVLSVFIYTNNTNYTEERRQLRTNIANITEKSNQLIQNNTNLLNETDQLKWKKETLLNQLKIILTADGWIYNQSSFYYKSSILKTMDASRSDCIARGADLIIINNSEEQDFVKRMSGGAAVWIGLNDIVAEGTWTWVDGSALNNNLSFWASKEPNGLRTENCAVSAEKVSEWPSLSGWVDITCDRTFQWICEMNISQLI